MDVQKLLYRVDRLSEWSGKAFAWLILILSIVVAVEVFKRYILNAPTAWIYDAENMLYGTLFMMCDVNPPPPKMSFITCTGK